MEVRDAVEADADRLADLTDTPTDVMTNLVHDRTVRVAVERTRESPNEESAAHAGSDGAQSTVSDAIRGFVSYDAREDTVHVTQLEGDPESCDRLLEEPVRFGAAEGMRVEMLVPEGETAVRAAAERAGFERVESGPRFAGQQTVRYRRDDT